MRLFSTRVMLVFISLIVLSGFSSSDYTLLLKSGKYHLAEGEISQNITGASVNGYYYRIMQFYAVPSQARKIEMQNLGIIFFDYLPKNAFLVAIPENIDATKISQFNVRSIALVQKEMKFSKNLSAGEIPFWSVDGNGNAALVLGYYPNLAKREVSQALEALGATFNYNGDDGFVNITISTQKLDLLSAHPLFYYIQESDQPAEPENFRARTNHRTNVLQGNYAGGLNYDGTGILVAHGDDGDIGPHIDYTGRLTSYAGASGGNHGDHVAGTVFGAGNLDPRGRGMSPGAEIAYFSYSNSNGIYLQGADTMYSNMGVRITQSSYSNGNNAGYTSLCREMDKDIRQNRALMHVFSAGNSGTSNFGYGAGAGWGNITGGHKQGKNVIATANMTWDDQLANSSSRGPAYDGRIKPDVGAVGTDVYSSVQPQGYASFTGTSMACPGVSGTLASLYQAYKDNNSQAEPDGGLMKAILMNSAEDVGNAGPDFKHGYGRINALRAVEAIQDHQHYTDSIIQGATDTIQIPIGSNLAELRVMVYWTDPEANVLASRALINNLDFTLYGPSSSSWKPWVLNPTPNATLLNAPAVRTTDTLNNAEQVTITNPVSGDYNVVITGTSIPTGPQKYYVVYTLVENEIKVTHPIGGEHFTPGQQEIIRWDAPAGTGNFTIESSTNNGSTWSTITTAVPSSQRHYLWTVPSTVTGQAKIRVSRGTKNSISEAPYSIIGTPSNLNIVWACPDSMLFTWNTVAGATGYEVSRLGAKYMDSVGVTSTNQFKFMGIDPSKTYWISVRALGPNGCVGERAVAIEKAPGVFGCSIAVDGVASKLLSPTLLPSCQGLTNVEVSLRISNNGQQNIYNVPLAYKIGNGAIVRDTLMDTVFPGFPKTFTFNTSFSIAGAGTYQALVFLELGNDQNKYNDTIRQNFRVYSSTLQSMPYAENFDNFSSCGTNNDCESTTCSLINGWQNAINLAEDDIDLRTNSGATPSSGTGPSADHTLGTNAGKYLYIEASGTCDSKVSELITPCFDLTGITLPEASIWYHMYGSNMGELHVDILSDGKWTQDIVTPLSGDKGNVWNKLSINLLAYVGKTINLRFRTISGNGYASDIALDDFGIEDISGPPVADFIPSESAVCVNTTITLLDQTLQVPTQWKWTITPSTYTFVAGSTDTSQSPEVTFTALGNYDIKLKASNSFGADSILKTSIVAVTNGDGLPVSEDFEGVFPAANWSIINPDGNLTWIKSGPITGATNLSTSAAWMDNFNYNTSFAEDILQTTKIDLYGINSAYLTFDVAYARYSATYTDGLRIEISTDCGVTFSPTGYNKQGTVLATVPDQTSNFSPSSSGQWRKDSVNITSAINNTVVIRFISESGYGNSLFIDNVNIIAGGIVAPVSSFTTSKNNVCVNDTLTYTSTSSGTINNYNWNFGAGAIPPTANTAGPHVVYYTSVGTKTASLSVNNPGGSNNSSSSVTVVSAPVSQFSAQNNDTLMVSFTDLSSNNPTAWTWDFGDGTSSNLQNPTHTYATGGQYAVKLTATNNCGSVDTTMTAYVSGIGMSEFSLANGIALLPNPASQQVALRAYFNTAKNLQIEILDISGKVLSKLEWQDARSGNDLRLDLSNMPDGVYLLKVWDEESSATKRLIIRK